MELILIVAAVVAFVALRKQHQRLKALERDVALLRAQVGEGSAGLTAIQPPQPVEADADAAAGALLETPQEEDTEEASPGPWHQAARMQPDEPPSEPDEDARRARRPDIETALGTRWTVWVGGLALALGGVFLVRYSIDAGIFGPRVRLIAAALFGIALAAAGEVARRKGFRAPVAGAAGAYVPAILTAAAAATLFGVAFAAHGIYGFIGPAAAFVLLGALALATIAAALIHGQALAGLGLLGSYATPLLVASSAPDDRALFGYLAIVLAATVAIASIRRWRFLAAAAYAGAGIWTLAYLAGASNPSALLIVLLHLVGLAMLGAVWLGRQHERDLDPASIAAGIFAALAAAILASQPAASGTNHLWAAVLLAAMLAVAGWRGAATPLLHAAGLALLAVLAVPFLGGRFDIDLYGGRFAIDGAWPLPVDSPFATYALAIAVLILAGGVALARLAAATDPRRGAAWAFWAALAPLCVLAITWVTRGNLDIDWRFAAPGLALAGVLAVAAELVARTEEPPHEGRLAVTVLLVGAAAALAFALLAGFGPVLTTVLTGLAAALPAAATRLRPWPVLGWASAALAGVTLIRIGIDPTIAGPEHLSTTPVLNALTPAYLLPALAFAYAAWQLARTTGGRSRLAMEAFAALFALLGAAMLVRHAMNGGVIEAAEPSLAEQAIYTLIVIGGGAILLALDRRAPSPVFRWGSMALGVLSVLFIASAHFIGLNPLHTNESTGTIPVFNLLLLAYLLPAAAMAALAWRASSVRPRWYVSMLSVCAAALGFAYVSLSVRRVFHGEFIGLWKGIGEVEAYSYSAVWLALGVAMLVAGLRFDARVLRTASAVLVVAAVAKVFLYDMRHLEGPLRALSFIGLGGVLIGIGMVYQRMLASARG